METRDFGTTGMRVSALGLGAAEIGFDRTPDSVIDRIIGAALDAGINVIDTAAAYSDSEEKIGRALRGRRSRFFIFTKCGGAPPWIASLGERVQRKARALIGRVNENDTLGWHPRILEWNIEESLRRLNVDCIDVIQLHNCSEETLRRGAVIEALQRARQAGKVRYIGYSGDRSAALYAVESGQFNALQTSINIADQEAIDLVMPLSLKRSIGVIAKRPIANGLWKSRHRPKDIRNHAYWDRLRQLQYSFLQDARDFETALRFTLSVPGVHTAIVGTTNPMHLRQNVETAEVGVLPREEFDVIRERWKSVARPDWVGLR